MERTRDFELNGELGMGNGELETEARLPIGRAEVLKAQDTLLKYKAGKASLDRRITQNEEWYRLRHWEQVGGGRDPDRPEPTSAWLLNSLMNKHADAMDNYPEANVLPREQGDRPAAQVLSSVLPTLLEQVDYEGTYSAKWWKKLKGGTGCTAVTWDPRALNGLGEISIKCVDILNLFWEPGIVDIQDGENFFRVDVANNEALLAEYPQLQGKLGSEAGMVVKYLLDDSIDTSEKTEVVDWYYKRRVPSGKTVVHYVKFAADEVLYASENLPELAETGYYAHGKYPFVFDILFPVAYSPAGFGYLDVCKDPQMFIDKLNQIMLMGAALSMPRYFVRVDGEVNEAEFADLRNTFLHWNGAGNPRDSIMPTQTPEMPAYLQTLLQFKVNELKETSGNTDFGQGVSAAGVTAASAIAALQEAGGKLSRDMLKATYRAFVQECYLVIELIRQFYDVERTFRIIGENGAEEYIGISSAMIGAQPMGVEYGLDLGTREPIFDIKVRASKASSFSRLSQNEMAKEFYAAGFFNPQMADQALACLEMMDFEGKEQIERRIGQNGGMYQQIQQMAQIIDQLTGGAFGIGQAAGAQQQAEPMPGGMPHASGQGNATNAVRDRVLDVGNPTK